MSPTLNAPVDMTAILCDYLRGHEGVSEIVGERVASQSPTDFDEPWVRVTALPEENATGINRVAWLVAYWMQIDCYAGAGNLPEEVVDLKAVVWDAVLAMPAVEFEEIVVTDAAAAGMPSPADDDLKPARHRRILDVEIFAHPRP